MLCYATLALAFVLSFTAAHADNYIGASVLISGDLDYEDAESYDDEFNSGYILTYGRHINENFAVELGYARYADLDYEEGSLKYELTSIELSGILSLGGTGPFARIGYGDADLKLSSDIDEGFALSGSETGLIYGFGYDFGINNDAGKLRFEYAVGDYDGDEIERFTIGSFINF